MTALSEETLNAYIDGALDADTRAKVEASLESEPAARELLLKLQRANALAVEAYDAPMREPVPQALIDTVLNRNVGRARDPIPRVPRQPVQRAYAMPIAAVFALVLAISGGAYFSLQSAQKLDGLTLGVVGSGSKLHNLLETQTSGRSVDIDGLPRRFSIVATFRDRHSRPCREVEVLAAGRDPLPLAVAVACRNAHGGWVVEGAVRLGTAPTAGQAFQPSGVAEKDALDSLLTMLGAQVALSSAEEQFLIQRGWAK